MPKCRNPKHSFKLLYSHANTENAKWIKRNTVILAADSFGWTLLELNQTILMKEIKKIDDLNLHVAL